MTDTCLRGMQGLQSFRKQAGAIVSLQLACCMLCACCDRLSKFKARGFAPSHTALNMH